MFSIWKPGQVGPVALFSSGGLLSNLLYLLSNQWLDKTGRPARELFCKPADIELSWTMINVKISKGLFRFLCVSLKSEFH